MTFNLTSKRHSTILSRYPDSLCVPAAELLRTRRGERERWRGGRRGLRDPPDYPPESPWASPAAPDGPRVQLPVSLHPSQRPDQPVLVLRAAGAHDVQHARAGRAPAVQPDALGESRCNPTMHCSEIQAYTDYRHHGFALDAKAVPN